MAKNNFLESAKGIQKNTKELLERLALTQSAVGELLVSVRHSESEMLEKEEQERKAREERERMERLREMLDSNQDLAVHAGGRDDEEAEPAISASKAEEAPKTEAKPEETEKTPVPSKEEAPKVQAVPQEEKPQAAPPEAPKKPVSSGYEAHAIQQDDRRRPMQQNDRAPYQQNRPPRQEGYQQRPQQSGGYAPRAPRPQQGGQYPRPGQQSGFAPRPATGTQPPRGPRPATTTAATPAASGKERVSNYDPNKSAYTRTREADNKKAKNKKAIARETAPSAKNWDEDAPSGNRRPKRGGKQTMVRRPEPVVIEKAVITTETITVKELSEKIGKPAAEIIKKLFLLGMPTTINQEIDFDTCELVASDFGIELELKVAKTFEEVLSDSASSDSDAPELLKPRPPVVTIMGHVDHGKTSLLDAIRNSSVTEGEAGGITQHIGAYTVLCNGKQITFIDTPGHEAFTSMRARGAQVTDIVILVVAADDGIMPQTVEAINHAKAAGVPIVVAINKMDKPSANPERIKQELTEYGIVAEEWGGDAVIVPVSAVTKEGIEQLLEMILLVADVQELKANPDRLAKGTIIEAKLDKGRGPVATVLVQTGTLKVGDTIVAGTAYGRVRAMNDDKGEKCEAAGPSQPVEVLGFSEVPDAGDILYAVEVDKLSRQVAQERRDKAKVEQLKTMSKVSLDDLFAQIAEGQVKELRIIIKADVQGSVEAVKQALEKLSNSEVRIKTIHGGVGAINEHDIMLASASNAIIIGFNVRPNTMARQAAETEKVEVRTYRVIYNAIEDIEKAMKGMLEPTFREVILGRVQVRNTFRITGVGTVAGCYVTDGKITRNAQVRLLRDDVVIHEGKIDSLKRFKDDAKEVAEGYECGVGLVNYNDIKEGDVFEVFTEEEVER